VDEALSSALLEGAGALLADDVWAGAASSDPPPRPKMRTRINATITSTAPMPDTTHHMLNGESVLVLLSVLMVPPRQVGR
jgi:hypothetical protein